MLCDLVCVSIQCVGDIQMVCHSEIGWGWVIEIVVWSVCVCYVYVLGGGARVLLVL